MVKRIHHRVLHKPLTVTRLPELVKGGGALALIIEFHNVMLFLHIVITLVPRGTTTRMGHKAYVVSSA